MRRDLQVRDGVEFPVWGSEDRDAEVRQILAREFFDPRLSDWSKVYDQALEITKEATTPYEAVVALETYFQTQLHVRRDGRLLDGPERPAARVLPGRRQERLLPDVLRQHGHDPAHARHPGARRRGLHAGRARSALAALRRHRPRRARVGRGLLPRLRLAALRADAVARPRRALLRHLERLRRRRAGGRGRLRAAGRHPARPRHARSRRRRRWRSRPVRRGRRAAHGHRRPGGRARWRCDRAAGRRRRLAARHGHVPASPPSRSCSPSSCS